eukprot:998055-Lingulodinium_polyedra.AAC.1
MLTTRVIRRRPHPSRGRWVGYAVFFDAPLAAAASSTDDELAEDSLSNSPAASLASLDGVRVGGPV